MTKTGHYHFINKNSLLSQVKTHQLHNTNCIWITTKCQNKQTQASAALFSICNKPPERQATASCLAPREWNRLYTWESTPHKVAFLNRILGTLQESPVRSHLQVLYRPVWGWGTGKGGERCTALRRSGEELVLACQRSGEREREISGTPVRRMNKVHLFIPSSFIRCHRQGFLKTQHTCVCLPPTHCLFVFHAHQAPKQTYTFAEKVELNMFKATNTTMQTVCKIQFQQHIRPASSSPVMRDTSTLLI